MKRLFILMVTSVIGFTVAAQTEKGNIVIGGSAGYSNYDVKPAGQKGHGLSINPSIGYFISSHLAVGSGIGYALFKYDQTTISTDNMYYTDNIKQNSFIVNPFARYYTKVNEKVQFFCHLSVPMYFGNSKTRSDGTDSYLKTGKNTFIGVALSPGISFFPTPHLGIEFALGGISYSNNKYTSYNREVTNDSYNFESNSNNSKSFNVGANFLSPHIGLQYYF